MITYKQIERVENYIKDVQNLKNNTSLSNEDLYNASENLDDMVVVSNLGYVSKIYWSNCVLGDRDDEYDVNEVKRCLNILQSALEGILNAVPYYQEIVEIREDIYRGKEIEEVEEKQAFVNEMIVAYKGKIDFGKEVNEFAEKDFHLFWEQKYDSIYNGVLRRMKKYLNEIGKEKQQPSKIPGHSTIVNVNQEQKQEQNQKIDISVSVENCFKDLDDCETLPVNELEEIKSQVSEIQELLKDKRGKKKKITERIGDILKWLGDKGTDVMIALLSLLIQMLKGL